MKRNNHFGVWQRCRVCGTIFSERVELQEHLATHGVRINETPRREIEQDLLQDDSQDAIQYSPLHPPIARRFVRREPNKSRRASTEHSMARNQNMFA